MEDKITLLEKLIKESKITLKEALVLLDDGVRKKETPITYITPYTTPYTTPAENPYWIDPFRVTCNINTACYPEGTTVTFTN